MNPRLLIKVVALLLLLIGVFVLKNFLAGSTLTTFFESMSFQSDSSSSQAASSMPTGASHSINSQYNR